LHFVVAAVHPSFVVKFEIVPQKVPILASQVAAAAAVVVVVVALEVVEDLDVVVEVFEVVAEDLDVVVGVAELFEVVVEDLDVVVVVTELFEVDAEELDVVAVLVELEVVLVLLRLLYQFFSGSSKHSPTVTPLNPRCWMRSK
jgi:hypothetical protein